MGKGEGEGQGAGGDDWKNSTFGCLGSPGNCKIHPYEIMTALNAKFLRSLWMLLLSLPDGKRGQQVGRQLPSLVHYRLLRTLYSRFHAPRQSPR